MVEDEQIIVGLDIFLVMKSCVKKNRKSTGNPGSVTDLENTKMGQILCGSTYFPMRS